MMFSLGSLFVQPLLVGLVGPHVTFALPCVRARFAALIGGRTLHFRNPVDGHAALLQGHGLGRPPIVGQCSEGELSIADIS